jgi:K+-sensing histidine kinase KdpD
MMLRRPSIISRYSFTVLAVTLSTLFRFALDPLLDLRAPFILYFPTVLLCAWFGGLWPRVLSAVLSGLIAWYVFFRLNTEAIGNIGGDWN